MLVDTVGSTVKQRIWNDLSSEEKQAYRAWEETSSNINSKTTTSINKNVNEVHIKTENKIEKKLPDEEKIAQYISIAKSAIKRGNCNWLKTFVDRFDGTIKQKIWNALSSDERQTYRNWREASSKQNLKSTETIQNANSPSLDKNASNVQENNYKQATTITQGLSNNSTIRESAQLSLFAAEEKQTPILKNKVPPPISNQNQQSNHKITPDDSTLINKEFVTGERVIYVGTDPILCKKYAGELTISCLGYEKVLVINAYGHLSSWLNYWEIKRI
ncbi:MAG: hypothetical protein KME64_41250 [Scytonematopsis contorta HA4267-MV1]|nr:hypothetical protein [Scytonematopsis contorta HA4267-MV1]